MKRIIVFLSLSIIILTYLTFLLYKDNFSNAIMVETKDMLNNKNYYEINNRLYKKQVSKFDSESITYNVSNDCYNHYTNKNKNKNTDKLSINKCRVLNNDNKEIDIKDELKNIIKLLSKSERKILDTKIIKIKTDYYAIVGFDANFHTPYKFYKYNIKENNLELLYSFDNEKVVGIKYKE